MPPKAVLSRLERMGRQEQKSEATRARLRAATERLLVDAGYGGTSTAEACRISGVSRGALLHHYPTRHHLIVDTAQHFWARAEKSIEALADDFAQGKVDIRGFVLGVFEQTFSRDRIAITIELIAASRSDRKLHGDISLLFAGLIEAYERGAVRAFSGSKLSKEQIHVIMTLIACTIRGLRVQEVVLDAERVTNDTLDSLIYAIEQIAKSGPQQFAHAFRSSRDGQGGTATRGDNT